MIIVIVVMVAGIISAVSENQSQVPGALCRRCGGNGWTETHGYGGSVQRCSRPNGRHF